jgi:hypothetical protein
VIRAINTHHIALIPFTVNHLGGLGPFAISLLFDPHKDFDGTCMLTLKMAIAQL